MCVYNSVFINVSVTVSQGSVCRANELMHLGIEHQWLVTSHTHKDNQMNVLPDGKTKYYHKVVL